jgi:hypothetical protein
MKGLRPPRALYQFTNMQTYAAERSAYAARLTSDKRAMLSPPWHPASWAARAAGSRRKKSRFGRIHPAANVFFDFQSRPTYQ